MNIELLISLVKRHEEIYNKQNSKFSSFKHKARVWQKIAKEMHVEVIQCKTKWNFLRNKFCKILKKMGINSGINNEDIPKWSYFDSLMFLKDHIVSRKYTGVGCGFGELHMTGDSELTMNETEEKKLTVDESSYTSELRSVERINAESKPKVTDEEMCNILNMIKTKLNNNDIEFFCYIDHFCNMIKSIMKMWPKPVQYETIMHITNYIYQKQIDVIIN